jgi:hypothetical protein
VLRWSLRFLDPKEKSYRFSHLMKASSSNGRRNQGNRTISNLFVVVSAINTTAPGPALAPTSAGRRRLKQQAAVLVLPAADRRQDAVLARSQDHGRHFWGRCRAERLAASALDVGPWDGQGVGFGSTRGGAG